MALELREQRNGMLRECWYGVFTDTDGKRKVVNLGVKWAGTPPASGRVGDKGDEPFERSREKAADALFQLTEEAKRKGRAEHLTERLIEMKTGTAVEYVPISALPNRWLDIPRDGDLSEGYKIMCGAIIGRFVSFMQEHYENITYLYQVKTLHVEAFAKDVQMKMSPKTYREHMRLLRPAFDRFLPPGMANPFRHAFLKVKSGGNSKTETDSIHRTPFTAEELEKVFAAASTDEFMSPLIICAAMTGMRRGDVCNLQWSAVDLPGGMVEVKTAKTGASVEIPIFSRLRNVFDKQHVKTGGKGYVFPEAAKMYESNADGLTYRFKKIVALSMDAKILPASANLAEIEGQGTAAIIKNTKPGPRRDRMQDTLRRYCAGQTGRQIEIETGRAKSGITLDLQTVEAWTGKRIIQKAQNIKESIDRNTRAKRDRGQKSASIRDWHALRTTWVTIALKSGVPMELVQRVTGHATTSIVLKNYFRPGREDFRTALAGALPDVLTGGEREQTPADELVQIASKIQAGTATEADKNQLRLLAAKV